MPYTAATRPRVAPLFFGTFVSAFLLFVGLGTLVGLFTPALLQIALTPNATAYQPVLPLAADRTEPFLTVDQIPPVQPFPANPAVAGTSVESGNWIRIPAIDVSVPLTLSDSLSDADVLQALNSGAALYPNGVQPGHLGNTFIAAHSTGNPWQGKYRFAFLRINELEPGHEIFLDYNGTRYTYRVTDTEIITPHPDYRVISDRPVPTMTLMACWPLWSTEKRMLKHAELSSITKLTQRSI